MSRDTVCLYATAATCYSPQYDESWVSAYLGDELSPRQKEEFEAHIHDCEYCAVCFHNWKKIVATMRANQPPRFNRARSL